MPGYKCANNIDMEEDADEQLDEETLLAEARELNPRLSYLQRRLSPVERPLRVVQIDINYVRLKDGRPSITLYGITEQGMTVLANIVGFRPYFYAELAKDYLPVAHNLALLKAALAREAASIMKEDEQGQVELEVVRKESVRGYKGQGDFRVPVLKIYTKSPTVIPGLRRKIEDLRVGGVGPQTFQSATPFVLRFMIDKGIVGMGWVEFRDFTKVKKEISWCNVEIEVHVDNVRAIPAEGEWAKLAPLRILSFDIECGCKEGFPQDSRDPVITIGCCCKEEGRGEQQKVVLTLGSCSGIAGVDVIECKNERELLTMFEDLICSYDPDFLLGYNMINFDLPYILGRAKALGLKDYGKFGRLRNRNSGVRTGKYLSKAMGMRDTKEINIEGRVQLDMMIHMHKDHKLSSYSLNNVALTFLKEKKEDVHHSQIHKLFAGTPDDRRRLAVYCVKDAELPLRLMERLMCLYNYAEMARVTGVPANYLFTRGQQIKVASQLYRKALEVDMIVPAERSHGGSGKVNFQGAEVLEPKQGFYRNPIATLDFASLYPSIMMAHNLCYTTLVSKTVSNTLPPGTYSQTPMKCQFVSPALRKGLLPQILHQLITARKKAKKELEVTTDPMIRAVLDGRQLALKVSANSVYGFTGAMVGQLPCLEISSSVTAIGRDLILQTKAQVEKRFGATVIYGDTDSVMCDFKVETIVEAMALGKRAAAEISEFIGKPPIKLEFEKVYCPYLLIAKKRYAGLLYTRPQAHDKIDTKGIENVRRDNCPLIRNVMNQVLRKVLVDKDEKGAADLVRATVSDLLMNRVDISQLIITKAITKKSEDEEDEEDGPKKNSYKVRQAHVELAEKMKKQNGEGPHIGDRIPYVIIQGTRGSKTYENAEDPIVVLNENKPIDFQYYINKQLRGPLERIFQHILKSPEELFVGEHTKHRFVPKPSKHSFMGKFIAQSEGCPSCSVRLAKGEKICKDCLAGEQYKETYLRKRGEMQEVESEFARLWAECQRCQNSYLQDVICSNRDCQIYYRRIKVRNELAERADAVAKLQQAVEW